MANSDFRTNAKLRQILARHWVDLQALRYGSFRGTVRLTGELSHVSGQSLMGTAASLIEVLEQEVRRIPGVRAVYFDFSNWVKDSAGRWERVETRDFCNVQESEVLEAVEASADESEDEVAENG